MFYNVEKLKDLIDFDAEKFNKKVLLSDGDNCLDIIAIKKGEILDTHTSVKDAAVYVIEGEIEIHFDAEKFKVEKGEIIMFEREKEHKVLANKDTKFLVIKI